MVDYRDISRRQVIRGIQARLKQIDSDEDVLLSERQVRGILDILSYVFKLETEYSELIWPDLCALLLAMAPKMEWAGYREQEWIQYLEQSITLANRLDDGQTAATLGIELGTQYERLGNLQIAENFFIASHVSLSQMNDKPNEILALIKLAHIAYLQEDFDKAEGWVDGLVGMHEIRTPDLAFLHFVQGVLLVKKNEHEKALVHFKQVLHLRQAEGIKRHIAVALNDLGVAFYLQKQYKQALVYLDQVLYMYQDVKSPIQCALTQMNIGCIYIETGQMAEGLQIYHKIEDIFRQSRDKYKLALLYNNWGRAYYMFEQLEFSEQMYHNSIKLWDELDVLGSLVNSMGGLGLIYLQRADRKRAICQFERCLQKLVGCEERPEYQHLYAQVVGYLQKAKGIDSGDI